MIPRICGFHSQSLAEGAFLLAQAGPLSSSLLGGRIPAATAIFLKVSLIDGFYIF